MESTWLRSLLTCSCAAREWMARCSSPTASARLVCATGPTGSARLRCRCATTAASHTGNWPAASGHWTAALSQSAHSTLRRFIWVATGVQFFFILVSEPYARGQLHQDSRRAIDRHDLKE